MTVRRSKKNSNTALRVFVYVSIETQTHVGEEEGGVDLRMGACIPHYCTPPGGLRELGVQ